MKKKLLLAIRTFFSMIHILYAKILNIRSFSSSLVQDFAPSTRIFPHEGGKIKLGKHIHARRGVVFEAEGGYLEIGEGCYLNNGCMIVSHESIRIGSYTSFGPNVLIYDHDHRIDGGQRLHDSGYVTAPVVIGNNVWIGANSVILRGTVIGNDCVIGAGSVIKGNYPEGSVVIQKRADKITKRRPGKEVSELV